MWLRLSVLVALLAVMGCKDKSPASTACEKLVKAGVARGCSAREAPPEASYAIDAASFSASGGTGRILVFKDDDDYDRATIVFKDDDDYRRAAGLYTGPVRRRHDPPTLTFPTKRILVTLWEGASDADVNKARDAL
jgi:hypothetical protein